MADDSSRRSRSQKSETPAGPRPSPRWYAPTFITLMLLGLLWVIVWYLSSGDYPVKSLGSWNVGVGFGIVLVGFMMTSRWR